MRATKEYRLKLTEEAKKIVEQMSLEEKVYLMSANLDVSILTPEYVGEMMSNDAVHYNVTPYEAGGSERFGIPPMKFVDGPRGVVCGNGQSTCFPVSMARGATFDPALEEEVGRAIGREVRAYGGNLFAGVCINMPYNPGWGRSQETYGEETTHIGAMGAALVRGVQDEDVMACVKHFAFNNMENARFTVSVTCDQRTEKEVLLPHFKDCLDAGAASIMSSYNRYNGTQCGHHHYLLTEILKGEWDFDGFVMSDFIWGVKDTVEAANGGQDIEMMLTNFFGDKLVKAVRDGFVPESRIDDAALRIIRTILAFDRGHKEYDMSVVGCKAHIDLARKVAEESITLIRNNGVLPLDRAKVRKMAVIGRLGDTANIGDHGSSQVRAAYTVTPLQGLKAAHPDCEIVFDDGSDPERAKKTAAMSDAVIFVVGYNHNDEGEFVSAEQSGNYLGGIGGDRRDGLGLHRSDVELLQAVLPENPNHAVVLIGGNMIMMTEWEKQANAVLMAYYPGQEGGTALAGILFGDVNPSGKLPYVVPYQESDLPFVDWNATDQYYEYYHGYTRLDRNEVKPLVPYGFGLSYTSFDITAPVVSVEEEDLVARVSVSNTGNRDGDEVVQMYVGCENSAVDRPLRQLKGFARVSLRAGETRPVEIRVPLEKLKWYNPVHREWKMENADYIVYTGSSEALEDLKAAKIHLSE